MGFPVAIKQEQNNPMFIVKIATNTFFFGTRHYIFTSLLFFIRSGTRLLHLTEYIHFVFILMLFSIQRKA